MSDAVPIILPPDYLHVMENLNWTSERQDQNEFYLGFPEDCLTAKPAVVRELDPGSRAAKAGVRDGDAITLQYSFFWDAERWGRKFSMKVRRSGGNSIEEMKDLVWEPRSWGKVESYQFTQS